MTNIKKNLSIYAGKTVLVTGDTGFKGSWLSIWLLSLGAKVIGYSLPPRTNRDNFVRCGLDKRIAHIDGDIRDVRKLSRVMRRYKPDMAFHLAAQPLVIESYKDPAETFDVNVQGTVNFLEAVCKNPCVKAAVVITTDKVYENPENFRAFRESDPLGGHDPYSASKAAAEMVVQSYLRSFFIFPNAPAIASARAGNVIGGGDWALHRIVPDCMRALAKGKPVVLRNPDSVRPWQHVLEPLYGYLLLGAALFKGGRKFAGAWNFGPDQKQTRPVRQLAETIIKEWGEGRIEEPKRTGAKPHEAALLRLDSSKARKALGWKPALSFARTIQWTVEEYRIARESPEKVYRQRTARILDFMSGRS